MWYKNIAGKFFGLVTKHAWDRQTDRQNYDSQDRASIAASRGNMVQYEAIVVDLENFGVTLTDKDGGGALTPMHCLLLM